MTCDARPVICDGSTYLVDPFLPPIACWCPAETETTFPPPMQCPDHACCMRLSDVLRCPNAATTCRTLQLIHRYAQAVRPPSTYLLQVPVWQKRQTVEEALFPKRGGRLPHSCELTPLARETLDEAVALGRQILQSVKDCMRLRWSEDLLRSIHAVRWAKRRDQVARWREWLADEGLLRAMGRRLVREEERVKGLKKEFENRRWCLEEEWD